MVVATFKLRCYTQAEACGYQLQKEKITFDNTMNNNERRKMKKKSLVFVLLPFILPLVLFVGIIITGFFAFSPLSYVELDIAIKSWCMFINGLLWVSLGWAIHWIEVEKIRKFQIPYLKDLYSDVDNFVKDLPLLAQKVIKFFYLSITFLKVIMTIIGMIILIISILQIRSIGIGKSQLIAIIVISIFAGALSLVFVIKELSFTS